MSGQATAQIGVTGLGVMGRNLARNFARHGYATALHNRTTARTDAIMKEFGHEGAFVPARTAHAGGEGRAKHRRAGLPPLRAERRRAFREDGA